MMECGIGRRDYVRLECLGYIRDEGLRCSSRGMRVGKCQER